MEHLLMSHVVDEKTSPGGHATVAIVPPDVQDDVLRSGFGVFDTKRPAVGLKNAVAADAEIADRLARSGRVLARSCWMAQPILLWRQCQCKPLKEKRG